MLNYRTALTADLPTMMKMVEEAKEGFRARNSLFLPDVN